MKIFEAHVSGVTEKYFHDHLTAETSLEAANALVRSVSGIILFFETLSELEELKEKLFLADHLAQEPDRAEYGDFQTNSDLAGAITEYLSTQIVDPGVLIEPTCGKGNFILAALKTFTSLREVYGIEIYKPYVWEAKFSILHYFLENSRTDKPEIRIHHCNVFDFDFNAIAQQVSGRRILVIGNPPWVTNSMLGSLNSANLPTKSNFKKHSGMDAITGKGNFDIAEYITLMMLDTFQHEEGYLALLVKNSVIKNIVSDQKKNQYSIGNLEKHCIDSKKEFNVSVEAALFFCRLHLTASFQCKEFDFYNNVKPLLIFGWVTEKFVSNIDTYVHSQHIDGKSPLEWRQGLKHDCSQIMELDKVNGHYVNALNESTELEHDLVYGILKSSDLKNTVVRNSRKYTIVTQRKPGQDTSYLSTYPKTYQYLVNHQNFFEARKSSIYKGKPSFSIFGIGDYSFKPFKVVISGLYKRFGFTLVLPDNQKPLMLDDTCYMLGFDNLNYAVYTLILLNSQTVKELLQSITFPDAKRIFTKEVLMRIDLYQLSSQLLHEQLAQEIAQLNSKYSLSATVNDWSRFVEELRLGQNGQTTMFK